jgi:hypothetical protein
VLSQGIAVKQIVIAVTLALLSGASSALPAECEMDRFPSVWTQAQSRVVWLKAFLETAEQKHPFAAPSAPPFRQALDMCRAKREAIYDEPRAAMSAGITSQMKCEALMICARIEAIELQ